jgi:hypothetical protein
MTLSPLYRPEALQNQAILHSVWLVVAVQHTDPPCVKYRNIQKAHLGQLTDNSSRPAIETHQVIRIHLKRTVQ